MITMTSDLCDEDGNPVELSGLPMPKTVQERDVPRMTREEREIYDQTHLLTGNQLGHVMSRFSALGFSSRDERPWYIPAEEDWYGRQDRLEIMSWIAGRDVSSVHDLTRAEAGKLIGILEEVSTVDELYDRLPDEYWEESDASSPAEMLGSLIIQAMRTWLNQPPGIPSRQPKFGWERVPLSGGE